MPLGDPLTAISEALPGTVFSTVVGKSRKRLENRLGISLAFCVLSPAIPEKAIDSNGGRDFFGTMVPQCASVDRGAVESTDCRSTQ